MNALRLVVDGRPLVGRRTGIGVHTAEIARRLELDPPPLIATHAEISDRTGIEHCRFRVDRRSPGVLWQQTILRRIAATEGNVLWGPHGTVPYGTSSPCVVTVHDLTSITLPGAHRWTTVAAFNTFISDSLQRASSIACVSRTTADAVISGFAVDQRRIELVHNGIDEFWWDDPGSATLPFDLEPQRYILYLGTIEPRKGVDLLVQAWETLPHPAPRLVICGSQGWGVRRVFRLIEKSPRRAEIIVTGYLERTAVRAMLRHSLMFVYPSLYEGFGLPPLEAMATGAPVIVSDGGALEEISGGGALVVPRGSVDELAKAIATLARDAGMRRELAARGREHASRFGWDEPTATMQSLFERAASR